MLKLKAVILSLAVVAAAVSGVVQARSLDSIIQSGTLRVGVNPNFPPMSSYNDKNELAGFDIDAANEIARNLNVKAEFVPTESAQRVPFLQSDRIDISLGALTRNSERAKLIDFTVPLHTRVDGRADHRQAQGRQLETAQQPGHQAGQHAWQLVGRLPEKGTAQIQRPCWLKPLPTPCVRWLRGAVMRSSRTSISS